MNDLMFWVVIAIISAIVIGGVFKAILFPLKILRKVIIVVLPLTALILYSVYGMPNFEDLPSQIKASLKTELSVAKIEKRLEKGLSLDDEIDVMLIIAYYKKLQNYKKLKSWYEKLYMLKPDDDDVYAHLIEAKILENEGVISDHLAFEMAEKFNIIKFSQPLIPYYLALFQIQNQNDDEALNLLQSLIKESHADDPWVKDVVDAISFIAEKQHKDLQTLIPKPLPPKRN